MNLREFICALLEENLENAPVILISDGNGGYEYEIKK